VVATATVGAGLAASVVRQALRRGALQRNPAPPPIVVTGYLIHQVRVVHHVVHHVGRLALPPARGT